MGAIPAIISQLCALALMVGCAAQQRETDFEGLLTSEARAVILDYDLPGMTVAVATVLRLSEEERLALDDPISRWLGDRVWFDRLPKVATITVQHLLQHRSGLPDHVHMPSFAALWPGREGS